MNIDRKHEHARRPYKSSLRAAQAESTRKRILDAVAVALRRDPERLSVAAIARAAAVSLPTVHRHFPTRRDLFEAYRLSVEGEHTAAGHDAALPDRLAAIRPIVQRFFRRFDDPHDPIGAVNRIRRSLAWEFSREITVPRRQAWIGRIIAREFPGLGAADRARLSDLFVVLLSASMGEAFRGYLDRSGRETADRVNWALEAVAAYAGARSAAARKSKARPSAAGRKPRARGPKPHGDEP